MREEKHEREREKERSRGGGGGREDRERERERERNKYANDVINSIKKRRSSKERIKYSPCK